MNQARGNVPDDALPGRRAVVKAFRRALLELPDDTRQRLQQMAAFYSSSEWEAFWSAAKASMDGDSAPIRAWAEERIGRKPDSVLRVHLGTKMLSEATPAETWAVVDHRGASLRRESEARDIKSSVPKIREGIRLYPSVARVLEDLALSDQSREQVLLDEIPGHVYDLELYFSAEELPGKIANQIRRENTPHSDHRSTLMELAEFAERETLLKQGRDARLPPREYELFRFFVHNPGATNAEAAHGLGVAVGTVKSMRHRIKKTLRIT